MSQDIDASLAPYVAPKRRIGLISKMVLTICFILFFALTLSTLLNFFNYEKTFSELVRSRYAVVLKDMSHSVEYGLGLGLSLNAINNIPEIIRNAKAKDDYITRIEVFDTQGRLLFSTESGRVGQAVGGEIAQTAFASEDQAGWSLDRPDEFLIGQQLWNNFNQREGALMLGFDRAAVQGSVRDMGDTLLRNGLYVMLAFVLLTILLVRLSTFGLIRNLRRMRESLQNALEGKQTTFNEEDATWPMERFFVQFQSLVVRTRDETSGDDAQGGQG